jgi:hypothetical protein
MKTGLISGREDFPPDRQHDLPPRRWLWAGDILAAIGAWFTSTDGPARCHICGHREDSLTDSAPRCACDPIIEDW